MNRNTNALKDLLEKLLVVAAHLLAGIWRAATPTLAQKIEPEYDPKAIRNAIALPDQALVFLLFLLEATL